MPSHLHEMLVELIRRSPGLVPDLLAGAFGLEPPAHTEARAEPADLTELVPAQFLADSVVVLRDGDDAVFAAVVEVQLRPDDRKRFTWPVYVATLRARWDCPTDVLVFCLDEKTAQWARTPIATGLGASSFVPLVLGPALVPLVTDTEQAVQQPELATLSALAHGGEPDGPAVLDAFAAAIASLDGDRSTLYSDLVMAALPDAARRYLEALVSTRTWEYQSDFVRKYVFQGRAEARAEDVLTVLNARDVAVNDVDHARITACRDLDQLNVWMRRAATADSSADLFD